MITNSTKTLLLALGGALLFAVALFIPLDAFAQMTITTKDVSQSSKVVGNQMQYMSKILATGAYVGGAFCAIKGIYALKGSIESPEENHPGKVVAYLVVAALLILLPYTISLMASSFGAETGNNITNSETLFAKGAITD